MRTVYFDLVGGAAGDMLLAALIDAGAAEAEVARAIAGLGLGARIETCCEGRRHLRARRLQVLAPDEDHPHRRLADVRTIITAADLPARARGRALAAFEALARAEGRVHGIAPEEVHFHEVGAIDSIVDTVGVAVALESLGIERVEASPLPVARGTIASAHGVIPLPAPAVLHLAEAAGAPIEGRAGGGEWVTPTGAALLTALAARFGEHPPLRVRAVGLGAGTRVNPPELPPNLVRAVVGELDDAAAGGEPLWVLEANLDDQSAEHTAYLIDALLAAGARDAFLTPVIMKKGRPGVVVTALAAPAEADALEALILRESSSLGVRRRLEARRALPREELTVETAHGAVRVKLATRPDGRRTAAPEFEDCARLARAAAVPLDVVYRAALRAAEDRLA